GLAREDQQPVARGVQREIDQHVDLVAKDQIGDLFIRRARDRPPVIRCGLAFLGNRIRLTDVGVAYNLKILAIMRLENRQEIPADNMLTKIWRDVTDSQSLVRIANIRVSAYLLAKRLGMHARPLARFLEKARRVR